MKSYQPMPSPRGTNHAGLYITNGPTVETVRIAMDSKPLDLSAKPRRPKVDKTGLVMTGMAHDAIDGIEADKIDNLLSFLEGKLSDEDYDTVTKMLAPDSATNDQPAMDRKLPSQIAADERKAYARRVALENKVRQDNSSYAERFPYANRLK